MKSCLQGGVLAEVFCYKSAQRLQGQAAWPRCTAEAGTGEVLCTAIDRSLRSHPRGRSWVLEKLHALQELDTGEIATVPNPDA